MAKKNEQTVNETVTEELMLANQNHVDDYIDDFDNSATSALKVVYNDLRAGEEGEVQLYKMVNQPDNRLSKMIDKEIKLVGFIIQSVDVVDKQTGELTRAPRIILIDDNAVTYECVSLGIFNEMKKLNQAFPFPRNPETAIKIKIVEKKGRNGYDYLTIEIV